MSKWFTIVADDIEVAEDKKSILVCVDSDREGNIWADIPIDLLLVVLKKAQLI